MKINKASMMEAVAYWLKHTVLKDGRVFTVTNVEPEGRNQYSDEFSVTLEFPIDPVPDSTKEPEPKI